MVVPTPQADADADGRANAARPLGGLRVLDFTRMFAGPCCTQVLADLGAEVVKLEEPRIGDPTRRNLPFWGSQSAYYMALNRGKQSVSVDLKSPEGREIAASLMTTADVVVENFRPGVMTRLGLDYAAARRQREDIIYCALSGFGATGPLRHKISFDLVNQAMAAVIDLTGTPDGPPVRAGIPIGDMAGGLFAALAVVAALDRRRRTGQGCSIDLGLHDVLLSMLGGIAERWLAGGEVPRRLGNRSDEVAPQGCYEARDGWLVVAASTDAAWRSLAEAVDRPDMVATARLADRDGRAAHGEEIDSALAGALRSRGRAEWLRLLRGAGVFAAPVHSIKETLDSAEVGRSGITYEVEHREVGTVKLVGSPIRFDGRRAPGGVPPVLGADTRRVLGDLGYSDQELEDLGSRGVLRTGGTAAQGGDRR